MNRIKKHVSGNRYVQTSQGMWVRDFTRPCRPLDINELTVKEDYSLIVENELANASMQMANIDAEYINYRDVIVVSDGYDFENIHHILTKIPDTVRVMVTNRALAKWKASRKIDFFVANNPYKEAMSQLPSHSYFPKCVVSAKTNAQFVKRYMRQGTVYRYTPVYEEKFSPADNTSTYQVDDYRNSICASINLAYRFGVRRLLLLCCDDSFKEERPGAIQLENELWMYPQHLVAHGLIEANLFWMRNQEEKEIKIANLSHGPDYKDVAYIQADQVASFFSEGK